MSTGSELKSLADSLYNNYLKSKIADQIKSCPRMEKATVVTAPNGSTMGVQLPFDETILNLPYATSLAGIAVGKAVWVIMPYSSLTNGIVIGDAKLSNL